MYFHNIPEMMPCKKAANDAERLRERGYWGSAGRGGAEDM